MFNSPAGRTVYGSGSYAPTRGQVSAGGAQGYLKRNLQQRVRKQAFNGIEGQRVGAMRVGNDGQSDTRSGVAQAALGRLGMVTNDGPKGPPGTHPHHPNAPVHNDGPKGQNSPYGPPPAPPGGRRKGGGGGGKPVPHVVIGRNGMVKLPYDSAFAAGSYSDLAQYNTGVMGLQQQQQQNQANYAAKMHQERQSYGQQQIADRASDSGAGMLFSSKYATDVGKSADSHVNNMNSLLMDRRNTSSDLRLQRRQLFDQLNSSLGQRTITRAQTAAQQAGTLGFGRHGKRGKK